MVTGKETVTMFNRFSFDIINITVEYDKAVQLYFNAFVAALRAIREIQIPLYQTASNGTTKAWIARADATYKSYKQAIQQLKEKWIELQEQSKQLQTVEKKQILKNKLEQNEKDVKEALQVMQDEIKQLEAVYVKYPREIQQEKDMITTYMKLGVLKNTTFKNLVKFWWLAIEE